MVLKGLLLKVDITFNIIRMLFPVIDRGMLIFFAGLIAGYLEMSGFADPASHSDNVAVISNLIGGLITVVSIISYFIHATAVEKHKIEFGVAPGKKYSLQTMLTVIHDFIVKKPLEQPEITQ